MRVIRVSKLIGKTIKNVQSPTGEFVFFTTEDDKVAILQAAGEAIADVFEARRDPLVQKQLILLGLTTEDEIMAGIAAEAYEKDLETYNALKAKLGL
jgi:hypothetical protein